MSYPSNLLLKKLNPVRFPGMSGKLAAIVGYILGQHYTNPQITELVITSDGFVLAQHAGEVGCNEIIGNKDNLKANWEQLLNVAGLTEAERLEAEMCYAKKIHSFAPEVTFSTSKTSHQYRLIKSASVKTLKISASELKRFAAQNDVRYFLKDNPAVAVWVRLDDLLDQPEIKMLKQDRVTPIDQKIIKAKDIVEQVAQNRWTSACREAETKYGVIIYPSYVLEVDPQMDRINWEALVSQPEES